MPVVPKDPTVPYPGADDPTDEVAPFERLMRRHALPEAPDVTIEEEIEREGIVDADPFAGFPAVAVRELGGPAVATAAAAPEASAPPPPLRVAVSPKGKRRR